VNGLRYLSDALDAREAFALRGRENQGEALHDFRVALRRLRTTVGVYAEHSRTTIGARHIRRLKKLARATGDARDAELFVQWLAKRRSRIDAANVVGEVRLLHRLEVERRRAYRRIGQKVLPEFASFAEEMSERLVRFGERLSADSQRQRELDTLLRTHAKHALRALRTHLHRATTIDNKRDAHKARIAAKHLRYLLEPRAEASSGGRALLRTLRSVQDRLGKLRDLQLIVAMLLKRADPTARRLQLRAQREATRAFGEFRVRFLRRQFDAALSRELKTLLSRKADALLARENRRRPHVAVQRELRDRGSRGPRS
jgi:CHAD domain-containing protein